MTLVFAAALGALVGSLASRFGQEQGFGLSVDIVVGVAGALMAGVLFPVLEAAISWRGGMLGELALAVIGAVFLLFIVRAIKQMVR
jgi:uncharacterized membrane protein YeaQ/YmgE (transglycosylase-associated protein family)